MRSQIIPEESYSREGVRKFRDLLRFRGPRRQLANAFVALSNSLVSLSGAFVSLSNPLVRPSSAFVSLSDPLVSLSSAFVALSDCRVSLSSAFVTRAAPAVARPGSVEKLTSASGPLHAPVRTPSTTHSPGWSSERRGTALEAQMTR